MKKRGRGETYCRVSFAMPIKLLDKYSNELKNLNSKVIEPLFKNIDVYDIDVDTPKDLDPKTSIFVGHKAPISEVVDLMANSEVEHFVQTDKEGFIYDLFAAAVMLQKPAAFIKNPLPFFISNFKPDKSDPGSVRSTTLTFGSSSEKSPVLHAISDFVRENPKTSNFIEAVHMIADELIMNSLYNAPVQANGKPMFMDHDRNTLVELPKGAKAKLFITHDKRRLLIGCEDPFGSVNRFKLMKQLGKVFKDDLSAANAGTGGAGLGCKMMIENSCGFYMVVKKGVRTLVCCALPLGVSYTKAERMSKNMHMVFF